MKKTINPRLPRLRNAFLALALVFSLTQTACFGSFKLTQVVWNFNKNVSGDKFVQELVFLALAIVPVYSLAILADALVVNSIEFWSGSNPVQAGLDEVGDERIVRLEDGSEMHLLRESEDTLRVQHAGETYWVRKVAGTFVVEDEAGNQRSVVREGEDGSVVLEADGKKTRFESWELAQAGKSPEAVTSWALQHAH